jgi:WD40 repeat protein/ankyrin repeat protein/serine/threonine protein kinase
MPLLIRTSPWLGCIALCLLLGCDQHGSIISPDPAITPQQGTITQEGENFHTPLHQAVLKGDIEAVHTLLATIGVNTPDKEGNTALHLAVLQNNLALVKILLEAKANVHAKNIAGLSPLEIASQKGGPQITEQLSAVASMVAMQRGGTKGRGMSLTYLLFHWDYENIGKKRILDHVPTKDKGNLRETCVEMNWMLLHKDAFHLRLTSDRLQYIRLQDYPRLYPNVQHANGITFQPIPADAVVQNVSDLKSIVEDSRFSIKNVVFKGELKNLKEVCRSLPQTANTIEIATDIPSSETVDLSQYEQLKMVKIKEPHNSIILPKGVTVLYDDAEQPGQLLTKVSEFHYDPTDSGGLFGHSKNIGDVNEEHTFSDPLIEANRTPEGVVKDAPFLDQLEMQLQKIEHPGNSGDVNKEYTLPDPFIEADRTPEGVVEMEEKPFAKGAFGQVYGGKWGGRHVALKKIDFEYAKNHLKLNEDEVSESLRWEISRLSTVTHPNIVQFYRVHEPANSTYLMMEYCEGGELGEKLRGGSTISWSRRWQWALQVSQGLAYLHNEGILHRDLKAANVLLDHNGRAKLGDLGVAQVDALLDDSEAPAVAIGLHDFRFIAPENKDISDKNKDEINRTLSNKATDVYALGLLLWEITSGKEVRGFNQFSWDEYKSWATGTSIEREPIPQNCPAKFKELILECWRHDPNKRPSAEELALKLDSLGAEFDSHHHALIKSCERLEKLVHPRRKETLSYIPPYVTEHRVEEPIESYWSRIEAAENKGEKPGNLPLKLWDTFRKFIKKPGSATLLLLGEGGLGKTLATYLFSDQLLSQWWAHINKGEETPPYFPLFIRPSISNWTHESIGGAFQKVVAEYAMPGSIAPLVFVDGYDELSLSKKDTVLPNLVSQLGLSGAANAKLIVTCRPNTVEAAELASRFSFNGRLETRYFLPFSLEQLLTYLKRELSWEESIHTEYKKTLKDAESVRTVLRNPFVLYLMRKSWETVSKKPFNRLNRWQIYEGFVEHTFKKLIEHTPKNQKPLLSESIQKILQGKYPDLLTSYQAFASDIAYRAFQKESVTLEWKESAQVSNWADVKKYVKQEAEGEFLKRQEKLQSDLAKANEEEQKKLKRRVLLSKEEHIIMKLRNVQQFEGELPMKLRGVDGDERYEYSHRSLFEYFIAKRLTMLRNSNRVVEEGIGLLNGRAIQDEKEALFFWEEGWGIEEVNKLKEPLFEIINASRHDSSETQVQASANAATLLAAAHVPFSGRDLSGIRIKGADLSNAVLNYTCLYKADLQGVILRSVWFDSADLREANLQEINFGEFSSLQFGSEVRWVSYSKDGTQMAVVLKNGSIEIYKKGIQAYKPIMTLRGHKGEVNSVTYSPDGKQIASGSYDNTVGIWDTQTLQLVTQLKGHKHSVMSVSYSPDGKQIASGSYDNTVGIWDMQTFQLVTQLEGHKDKVNSVTYSPDGKRLASGSSDNTVRIWDTQTLQPITQLKKHSNWVRSVIYSPDGKQLASGGGLVEGELYIWNTETLQPVTRLKGHSSSVYSVTYSPDGKQIASGSDDHTIGIWDTRTLQSVTQLKGHSHRVTSVAYSPDGKQLASGSLDNTVGIWDMQTLQPATQLKGHSSIVWSVTYSPGCNQLASGNDDNTVGIWDTKTLHHVTQLNGHSGPVYSVTYSPNGKQLASGGGFPYDRSEGELYIWNTETLQSVTQLKGHTSVIRSVIYSPDGKQLASGSDDNTVGIWDTQMLQSVTQLKGHKHNVRSVMYSPDGKQLASGGGWPYGRSEGELWIWDMQTLQPDAQLISRHSIFVSSVTYSPDGKQLVSGMEDTYGRSGEGELWIWDMQTLRLVNKLKGHSSFVSSVTYSPDGKQLASGGGAPYGRSEGELWIWNMETFQPAIQLKGHTSRIWSVKYSPDGKQLASGSNDNSIFLWAKQSAACLPGGQEKWQLVCRFERGHRLSAEGALLKGTKISGNNMALLKQRGANDDQNPLNSEQWSLETKRLMNSILTVMVPLSQMGRMKEYKRYAALLNSWNITLRIFSYLWEGENFHDISFSSLQQLLQEFTEKRILTSNHQKSIVEKINYGLFLKQKLIAATSKGYKEEVELLLNEGANTEVADKDGNTPLVLAVKGGHKEKELVELLLSKGANTEAIGNDGLTSLLSAVKGGRKEKELVELLLGKGANTEAIGNDGLTPLLSAVKGGRKEKELVELLLSKGANIEAIGNDGSTSLLLAVKGGHKEKELVGLLLSKGANIEAIGNDGLTSLLLAVKGGHKEKELVELLLSKGANIEAIDNDGLTPLLVAAANGYKGMVELLLSKGANIEAANNWGSTALMYAAQNSYEIVELLLGKGTTIEASNKYGKTALLYATEGGLKAVVKLLLNRGANIEAKNEDGKTALMYAESEGYKEIVELLSKEKALKAI